MHICRMDKHDIIKANLQALIDHVYGTGARGARTPFARRIGRQSDYISRCLNLTGKAGAKNIGEDLARAIEREYGLPPYSMGVRKSCFDKNMKPPWLPAYCEASARHR